MKACAGGDVKIEIGVMHAVQPPQRRHRVEHYMLQVDREIEDHDGRDDGDPERHIEIVERTPATLLGQHGEARRRYGQEHTHEHAIEENDAEITRPAAQFGYGQPAAGEREFCSCHDRQHAEESRQTNRCFVLQ